MNNSAAAVGDESLAEAPLRSGYDSDLIGIYRLTDWSAGCCLILGSLSDGATLEEGARREVAVMGEESRLVVPGQCFWTGEERKR